MNEYVDGTQILSVHTKWTEKVSNEKLYVIKSLIMDTF